MKKLLLIMPFFMFFNTYAQIEKDCDNVNKLPCCPTLEDGYRPEIPSWEKISCKTIFKEAEYGMFPKLLEYKGYIFREVISCAVQNMDCILTFDYCIPKTRQKMRIEIKDYKDPFFQTEMGKASKNIDLLMLQPNAIALGSRDLSVNKKYKNSKIVSARFSPYGGKSDTVGYIAYVNERYFISISIDDKPKRFTESLQVEEFLKDYISQINLTKK